MGSASRYDHHMHFRLIQEGNGQATYEAHVDESMANPMGVLHGGVLAGLADSAMGAAFMTTLAAGTAGTNIHLSIDFLRPTHATLLRASAQVVKRGRTISLLACDIHDPQGRLVARASSSFLALAPPAAGR